MRAPLLAGARDNGYLMPSKLYCVCKASAGYNPPNGMTTYLLTWNPERWPWDDFGEGLRRVRAGESYEMPWSTGNTRNIPVGSRVFLLKQGVEPRGLIASGWTTGLPDEHPHWDPERASKGDLALFVPFAFDWLIDPTHEDLLDPRNFPPGPLLQAHWTPVASGTSIGDDAATALEELWAGHTGVDQVESERDPEIQAVEGEVRWRLAKHRLRERALRNAKVAAAMEKGPLACEVPGCGFVFESRYGDVGEGYAQVHHLRPLSALATPEPTRLEDLAVVCANCHAMIHRGGACRALATLIRRS